MSRTRTTTQRDPAAERADPPVFDTARPRVPAWLGSALLHAAVLIFAGIAWRNAPPRGLPGNEPDRRAAVAVVDVRRAARDYLIASESDAADSARQAAQAAQTADPLPAPDAAGGPGQGTPALPDPQTAGPAPGSSPGLPGADSMTSSGKPSRSVGGQATTSIFGAGATGTRFVYVFDRSASMDGFGGRPLRAAKQQLLASLDQLGAVHQFQIVFYNERPSVFNPDAPKAPRLLFADDQGRRLARQFVEGMTALGGTGHWEALQLAVAMKPDVIFFLTDGSENPLAPRQLASFRRQAERAGTTVHSIEFGGGPPNGRPSFLTRLAEQNGGQYVYVDVTRLPP
ncbi:MAG: hypothetical protein FJ297_11965 [Planctomycetes bacterium]|nr:hypothetical protein [Planctomycetota bacterium]